MRALVYTGPGSLELRAVPEPTPDEGDVLVEVAACGICGSDMHAYHGHDERRPAPLVLGHEAAGTIIQGPHAGTRVAVNPLVTCGRCDYCRSGRDNLCPFRQIISMQPRPGAFAERLAIPAANCTAVPDGTPLEAGALVEPLACGWHAVRIAARVLGRPVGGLDALVIGGGAIGVGAALAARAHGAHPTIVEPHQGRRSRLEALRGVTVAGSPPDRSYPLILDAVGNEATRRTAFSAAAPGGAIIHIGLGSAAGGMDARRATLQEISFTGTYTYTAQDFRDTAEALFTGRLGPANWHETRPLEDGPETFRALGAGQINASKIILRIKE